jgi:rubrerythrin
MRSAMPTLTPTYENDSTTKASDVVYAVPERRVTDDALAEQLPDIGMNTPFIADILSMALAHERCGRHLYRTVSERTNNPILKAKYTSYGEETERHAEILENLITAMGGNPNYVSPAARATEGADTKLVESTYLLAGSVDIMTQEMVMLDAVLLAETVDHANWTALAELADELPEGAARDALMDAVAEVGPDEDDHLEWARSMRLRMIQLQAKGRTMAAVGAKVEELVETVRGWFK